MVLTDEPYAYPDLDNVVTPKAHRSPLGLAKHKARALDYFRQHMGLTGYDHVLHMDEESTMDAESVGLVRDYVNELLVLVPSMLPRSHSDCLPVTWPKSGINCSKLNMRVPVRNTRAYPDPDIYYVI